MWFLAGIFGAGEATRTCAVPEDTELFFPVINSVFFDSPNVCGQGPESFPVEFLRLIAPFVEEATNLSVKVDGEPIDNDDYAASGPLSLQLPCQRRTCLMPRVLS